MRIIKVRFSKIVAERLKSARSANHILPDGQKKERGGKIVAWDKRLGEETQGVSYPFEHCSAMR